MNEFKVLPDDPEGDRQLAETRTFSLKMLSDATKAELLTFPGMEGVYIEDHEGWRIQTRDGKWLSSGRWPEREDGLEQ